MKFKILLMLFVSICLLSSCKKKDQANIQDTLNEILFVKTSKGLNLREEADQNSKVLTVIPQGTAVRLINQKDTLLKIGNEEGRWLKVQWGGKIGWAFSPFLIKGKYEQDFFLLFSDIKKSNYYVIKYNDDYLQLATKDLNYLDIDGYKFADMDNFNFSAGLPISKNEKVVIINDKNEIQNDVVESFHVLNNDLIFLIFKIKNNNKNNRICIRDSYLKKHNVQIYSANKENLENESLLNYRKKVIDALKNKTENISLYASFDSKVEEEYKKDPEAFIDKNFTIEINAYKKNSENYILAQLKNKNDDKKAYNVIIIFYNDKIVYTENAELFQLFFLNDRLIMYTSEWTAHTGIYVELLTEISAENKVLAYIDFSN